MNTSSICLGEPNTGRPWKLRCFWPAFIRSRFKDAWRLVPSLQLHVYLLIKQPRWYLLRTEQKSINVEKAYFFQKILSFCTADFLSVKPNYTLDKNQFCFQSRLTIQQSQQLCNLHVSIPQKLSDLCQSIVSEIQTRRNAIVFTLRGS